MEETKKSLEDLQPLKEDVVIQETVSSEEAQPKKDDLGRSYATGKRKGAVARVWLKTRRRSDHC